MCRNRAAASSVQPKSIWKVKRRVRTFTVSQSGSANVLQLLHIHTHTHTHKHTVFEQIDFVYLFVFTNLSANVHSNQWNIIEFTLAADRFTFHTRIRQKEAEAAEDGMRQESRSLCVCVCVGNEVRNKTPTKFTQNLENNLTAFRYRNCFRSNRYR